MKTTTLLIVAAGAGAVWYFWRNKSNPIMDALNAANPVRKAPTAVVATPIIGEKPLQTGRKTPGVVAGGSPGGKSRPATRIPRAA